MKERKKHMSIKIGRIVLGSFQTNCYFLYREDSHDCIVVDPAEDGAGLYEKLKEHGFAVKAIFLTHGHFDHIYGVEALRQLAGASVYACEREKPCCEDPYVNMSAQCGRKCTVKPDIYVPDGQEITVAGMTCRLIWTPGHTMGSCCYYFEKDGILVSGDTLFLESVGRTDFPGGSMSKLIASIKEKLFVLPEETKVYPGHGDSTTIKVEKQYNPFCQ